MKALQENEMPNPDRSEHWPCLLVSIKQVNTIADRKTLHSLSF